MFYILEGEGTFGSSRASATAHQLVVFENDGETLEVQAAPDTDLRLLLLAGEPIDEPIARAGRTYLPTIHHPAALADVFYACVHMSQHL